MAAVGFKPRPLEMLVECWTTVLCVFVPEKLKINIKLDFQDMLRVIESKSKPIVEHSVLAEQLEQVIIVNITIINNASRAISK